MISILYLINIRIVLIIDWELSFRMISTLFTTCDSKKDVISNYKIFPFHSFTFKD